MINEVQTKGWILSARHCRPWFQRQDTGHARVGSASVEKILYYPGLKMYLTVLWLFLLFS